MGMERTHLILIGVAVLILVLLLVYYFVYSSSKKTTKKTTKEPSKKENILTQYVGTWKGTVDDSYDVQVKLAIKDKKLNFIVFNKFLASENVVDSGDAKEVDLVDDKPVLQFVVSGYTYKYTINKVENDNMRVNIKADKNNEIVQDHTVILTKD